MFIALADNPLRTKFWWHWSFVASFKTISLKSDFIQFFHDFIHVYSLGAGADSPQVTKFWCQQKCLVTSFIWCKFKKNVFEVDFIQFFSWFYIIMPRHQKVAGYYVIPSEILSVRPSVRLSVHPSVRPSAPTTILVSATPPTVLGQSFWNFTGVLWMVWRYAYCFFRILKLFFITFFPFLTRHF